MKRVLVTGPNGFIGRHCLPFLLERGYELHGVVPENGLQLDIPGVKWHIADLLNTIHAQALIERVGPTHLLHFAWYAKPGEYWTSMENLRWLQASLDILQIFKRHGGQRVLMAGTCAEYDWRYGYCSEYITPLNPATLYGTCKKSLYEILMSFSRQEGLSASWGRIFFLYGSNEYPSRLIPSVINSLLAGRPAPCTMGSQIRDFMHVEDVASAFAALLDSEIEGAVNIASGEPVTIRNIILRIAEKLDRSDLVQFGAIPTPKVEPPLLLADVNRLRQEIGWTPLYNLDAGLDKTIDWWKRQKVHNG
ncbi:MAG: NAD-dependent epimerase/dehydratase family protein [Anaerolineales bacterium]